MSGEGTPSKGQVDKDQVDEFFVDSSTLRRFVEEVRQTVAEGRTVEATLDALQPRFTELLADQSWLPDAFALPYAQSDMRGGMGGGIASWLLFRAADRSLSLISLVVPPGVETPVHDHLAWGFVGLYRGEQRETVYVRQDDHATQGNERGQRHEAGETETGKIEPVALAVAQVNDLKPGDFYRLIPPDGDIHSVKTTSPEPSVSIHLLTNDIGCVVRHAFDPQRATARPFRSGYSNVACLDETQGQGDGR